MMHPFDATLPQLREEHRISISGMNAWACSCGAGPRSASPNRTAAQAQAAADRHVHAEHRRLIQKFQREATP